MPTKDTPPTERQDTINQLRDMADWLERHPEFECGPVYLPDSPIMLLYAHRSTAAAFEHDRRAFGFPLPTISDDGARWANSHKTFGPFAINLYVEAEKVCRPVPKTVTSYEYTPPPGYSVSDCAEGETDPCVDCAPEERRAPCSNCPQIGGAA